MRIIKEYFFPRMVMDFMTFYPALMIIGIYSAQLPINLEVILGMFFNYLMLIFSFMYNDLADREDDRNVKYKYLPFKKHILLNLGLFKKDGFKRFKNPFSNETISIRTGYFILFLIAATSIIGSYLMQNTAVAIVAAANIFLGIVYSGGIVRFKARPIVDVLSHSLLLAFVQILYFIVYTEATVTTSSILFLVGVTIVSMGGALENQYRDFKEDQLAKLGNTASVLGRDRAKTISVLLIGFGVFSIVVGIILRIFNLE